MFKSYREGSLRGLSVLRIGERDLFDISLSYIEDEISIGLSLSISKDSPVFFGIALFKVAIYIEVLGIGQP